MFPDQSSHKPYSKCIEGVVVKDWGEAGKWFQIEELAEPRRIGAGLRLYRLWIDGHPAYGGQWHYTFEAAIARAEYETNTTYIDKISWLEHRIQFLERLCSSHGIIT